DARRRDDRARRPRQGGRPLPRDPRPLLLPRRELPHDRRPARHPRRHHRQPDLSLPRKSSCRSRWKESGLSPVMKIEMNGFDEERIGRLLRLLPPAPEGWVRAAQELPAARAMLDELVMRAEQDAAFRLQLRADLERAIADAGYDPSPFIVSRLRRLLEAV